MSFLIDTGLVYVILVEMEIIILPEIVMQQIIAQIPHLKKEETQADNMVKILARLLSH